MLEKHYTADFPRGMLLTNLAFGSQKMGTGIGYKLVKGKQPK